MPTLDSMPFGQWVTMPHLAASYGGYGRVLDTTRKTDGSIAWVNVRRPDGYTYWMDPAIACEPVDARSQHLRIKRTEAVRLRLANRRHKRSLSPARVIPGVPFADQPANVRMYVRHSIEDIGASVEGYYGPGVQVRLPRDWINVDRRLESMGLTMQGDRMHYFPAESGTPDRLRHDGRYPGSRGFVLQATYVAGSA